MFEDLMEFLPFIFDYYVPGAVFFFLRGRVLQIKLEAKDTVAPIITLSVVIKFIVDAICNTKLFAGTPLVFTHLYYILAAVILFALDTAIVRTNFANKCLVNLNGLTFQDDVWARVVGSDGKTAITVTLSDGSVVTGRPMYINKEYISIAEYSFRNKDVAFGDTHNDYELCTVLIKDIKMIQTKYLDGSEVKELNKSLG